MVVAYQYLGMLHTIPAGNPATLQNWTNQRTATTERRDAKWLLLQASII